MPLGFQADECEFRCCHLVNFKNSYQQMSFNSYIPKNGRAQAVLELLSM